jgi:uncharacterized protein (DUF2141 family)
MKRQVALSLAIGVIACCPAAADTNGVAVRVEVGGIRGGGGRILASLFNAAGGFPADHTRAFRCGAVPATGETARIAFTNIPAAAWALGVCHDSNSNGRMDKGLFGRPIEGYAVSGNSGGRAGPPRFEDCLFKVFTNDVDVKVNLVYPGGSSR